MTYREIFDDVVDIMKHDSATCIDIEGADPAPFREEIREDMTDKEFDISRFFKSLTPE